MPIFGIHNAAFYATGREVAAPTQRDLRRPLRHRLSHQTISNMRPADPLINSLSQYGYGLLTISDVRHAFAIQFLWSCIMHMYMCNT